MTDSDRSRRDVLQAAAAAGATGLLGSVAGCQGIQNAIGLGSNETEEAPEDADAAMYADVQAVLDDEAVRTLANAYIDRISQSEYYEGPEDFEAAREEFESESDLDSSAVQWQLGFTEYSDYGPTSEYGGTIVRADWSEDEVVESFEENGGVEYEESEYGGQTVYEPTEDYRETYLGVLSDGKYVYGPRGAVEDVIDVAGGDEDAMDEDLRSAYGSTRNAPVRYVGEMLPLNAEETTVDDQQFDLTPLEEVDHVAGSVYADGDARGVETTMTAESEDDATDVADLIDGYFRVLESMDAGSGLVERIAEDVAVERNGSDVVVTYEATVDELESLLEDAIGASGSASASGSSSGGAVEGQAGASISHSGNEITVTWTSNQNAERLQVAFANETDGTQTTATLTDVGESTTYTCESGETTTVGVTAETDDSSTVILRQTIDC